jgi:RNA 2',3'-cyclic 3'-phosphodiesterase
MASDSEKPRRVRLFVALDLPEWIRDGIATWGEGAVKDPALRPVSAASLHITLAFLGSRPPEQVESLGAILRECAVAAPVIELGEAEQRPMGGRARVYALPVRSEATKALQADLRGKLVSAGLYEAEARPFWPHVTVARVRKEGRGSQRPAAVQKPPKSVPRELLQPFGGVRLALYLSQLQPGGARYTPLAQVDLPEPGRQ